MLYPPLPRNISIPAVVAGNILENDDTSISAIDSGYDGAIVMRTENKLAVLVSPEQKVSINTEATSAMLTINSDLEFTSALRMSYQDTFFFDGRVTANGSVVFYPSCDDPILDRMLSTTFNKNFNISDHDGGTRGLRLGGTLITASGSELNYVDVQAGVASANKALVLDSNKNISGLNAISANQLGGTLLTGNQPNITSLASVNITGTLSIRGDVLDIDPPTLRLLNVQEQGVAYPSKAMILDASKNYTGINSLTATYIAGTITTPLQPNIRYLPSLLEIKNAGPTSLNGKTVINTSEGDQLTLKYNDDIRSTYTVAADGNLALWASGGRIKMNSTLWASSGLILGNDAVTATARQINFNTVEVGVASANRSMVLDSNKNLAGIGVLTMVGMFGLVKTASQPLITSVSVLDIANHNGGTAGLLLGGALVTATAAQLNRVNTVQGTAAAGKTLVLDTQKNISGINALSAETIAGVVTTADQPNIRQVKELKIANHNGIQGLTLGTTLVVASGAELNRVAVAEGVATASKAVVLSSDRNIAGINNLSAANIAGTITTVIQPNIEQVNKLNVATHNGTTGLSLNGVLVTATANQLNRVSAPAGVAVDNKALVLDSSLSISGINVINANAIGGVLSSPTQPNIRQLASINIYDHDGSTSGLSLADTLVTSSALELNYVNVTQGIAAASKALVLDSTRKIKNIHYLEAAELKGVLVTNTQPNITRVNTLDITQHDGLTGLSLGGVLVEATANQINSLVVTPGQATPSKAIVLSSVKNVIGINNLSAATITGTLTTGAQPNITSVTTLNITGHVLGVSALSLGGVAIASSAVQINMLNTTPGNVQETKAVIADSRRNISNINELTAAQLTGTIMTQTQPNITQVETLNLSRHDGGSSGLKLNNQLVIATASQLNYTSVAPGTATAMRAMVTNEFNSITGINSLSATKVTAEELQLSGVVSNFSTGAVVIKSYSFTDLVGRMIDIRLINSIGFSTFTPGDVSSGFSSEIIGYICPQYSQTYTFYVTCSDRVRLWVNGELILHSWTKIFGSARTSSSIFLNAGQWVPIYAQYQVDTGSAAQFLLEWYSINTPRASIPSDLLAWDNNAPAVGSKYYSQNSFTIYNTSTVGANAATLTVDTGGDLTIDASGNDVYFGNGDNVNIPAHNGTTSGLILGGVLVKPTAYELNYLKVTPGKITPSQAVVVDASKSLTGFNSITAVSLACDNLSTSAFTINNLTLSGPLNNFSTGGLLIRQFTGLDWGRIVYVDTISDLNFNNFDPKELNSNYAFDIAGYVLPTFTEVYRFYAVANDRVRIWVNNVLIMNVWDSTSGVEYASDPISLVAGQWVPIYIQFQNIVGSSLLQVKWSSTSLVKSFISNAFMAWDNSVTTIPKAVQSSDRLTIFSSAVGLTSAQTGTIAVDGNGAMAISCKSGNISVASAHNFNIIGHNGTTTGLRLAGGLVNSTAAELNYLAGITPGRAAANKVMVLNDAGSLAGFNSIESLEFVGVLKTANQPNITSIGTMASTLNTTSDIVITSTNVLRLSSDASACYIQAGSANTPNASADLFIGNYGASIATSARKTMIKANGFVGIQTSSPTRALSINGAGAPYCMRLINNSSSGTETAFCDLGVDSSSNLRVGSNLVLGATGTATVSVSGTGVMKIAPSGGSLQVGNTINSVLPLEVGTASFTLSSAVGYVNAFGSTGKTTPTETSYSIRTDSSIIVNGTVCITSDRRLKKEIETLSYERCRDFILGSNPVKFVYTSDPTNVTHYGLIAQDVVKTEFRDIVKLAPYQGVRQEIEVDGYVSPADAVFNVAYDELVPILMTTTKEMLVENASLREKVSSLEQRLAQLESMILSCARQ